MMSEIRENSTQVNFLAFTGLISESSPEGNQYFDLAWAPKEEIASLLAGYLKQPHSGETEWDQQEFTELYENILSKVASELNRYHSLNLDIKQWEVMIGYWLIVLISSFIPTYKKFLVMNSKYGHIQISFKTRTPDFSPIYPSLETNRISEDVDFYSYILEMLSSQHPSITVAFEEPETICRTSPEDTLKTEIPLIRRISFKFSSLFKQSISNFYFKFHKFLNPRGVYIVAEWIPARVWVLLSIRLRSVVLPIEGAFKRISQSDSEFEARENWLDSIDSENNIERLLLQIVERSIPKSILEDFKMHQQMLQVLHLDFSPRFLISNLDHCTGSDLKRIWFGIYGQKAETFSVMQHGGGYGCYKNQLSFFFERRISNVFLAWGWERIVSESSRIVNIPSLRLLENPYPSFKSSGPIYILLCPEPKFPTIHLPSQPTTSYGFVRYLFDLSKLLNGITEIETMKIKVKPQSNRINLINAFFQTYHPVINLDVSSKMGQVKSQLLISTYNGTNAIECLLSDVPTIFYWEQEYCNFSDRSEEVFTLLRNAGILHSQKESALQIINLSPQERKKWWDTPEVQYAREQYLAIFGDTTGGSRKFCGVVVENAG